VTWGGGSIRASARRVPETSALRQIAEAATDGRVFTGRGPLRTSPLITSLRRLGYDALDRRRTRAPRTRAPFGESPRFLTQTRGSTTSSDSRCGLEDRRTEGDLTVASAVARPADANRSASARVHAAERDAVAALTSNRRTRRPGFDPSEIAVVETHSPLRSAVLAGRCSGTGFPGRLEVRLDVAVAGSSSSRELRRGWSLDRRSPAPLSRLCRLMAVRFGGSTCSSFASVR